MTMGRPSGRAIIILLGLISAFVPSALSNVRCTASAFSGAARYCREGQTPRSCREVFAVRWRQIAERRRQRTGDATNLAEIGLGDAAGDRLAVAPQPARFTSLAAFKFVDLVAPSVLRNLSRRRDNSNARATAPLNVATASLKVAPSRCFTKAMTSPPTLQPRQWKTCLTMLTANRSVPPHTGQGPTRSIRPRSVMPRSSTMRSIGTAQAQVICSAVIMATTGHRAARGARTRLAARPDRGPLLAVGGDPPASPGGRTRKVIPGTRQAGRRHGRWSAAFRSDRGARRSWPGAVTNDLTPSVLTTSVHCRASSISISTINAKGR